MKITYPEGLAGIKKFYGDPMPYLRHDGTIHPSWERFTLDYAFLPEALPLGWDWSVKVTRVRVHTMLVAPVEKVLKEIHKAKLWDKMYTFDGSYAWRQSRGAQRLSTHCWGIALDFNAATNGLGEKGDMAPEIVEIFERHGWVWGGRWDRPDPMHFQAARGY